MGMQMPERLRSSKALRDLVQEHDLRTQDLVLPLFLNSNKIGRKEIKSMPGVFQWSVEESLSFVHEQRKNGIKSFILFGIVDAVEKNAEGSAAWGTEGPVVRALTAYRKELGDVNLFADTCFCEYTDHGHCGPIRIDSQSRDPKSTLEGLQKMSVLYAQAGANVIAPSGMVDGMVSSIRKALDEAKQGETAICSYAVKYASSFYGPFREAAENAPAFGDRKTYQMNPANRSEALREASLDVAEGADMLLIKPAMPCLDIVREVVDSVNIPVGVYQVSGEYSMMKVASASGCLNEEAVFTESLLSAKRAGARFIISYWSPEAARILKSVGT